jgi:hypothetical protein
MASLQVEEHRLECLCHPVSDVDFVCGPFGDKPQLDLQGGKQSKI